MNTRPAEYGALPAGLPDGSGSLSIRFVPRSAVEGSPVCTLPVATGMVAQEVMESSPNRATDLIRIVSVPGTSLDDTALSSQLLQWVRQQLPESVAVVPVFLQGAIIFWSPALCVVIASPERLSTVRTALIEFCFHEGEVRRVEEELSGRWAQLEKDTPLAFEFHEQALGQKRELNQRFQEILLLRSRVAKTAPHVECPPVYPPTLMAQAGERLREKSRLPERLQFVREQLEVFERVYELCGQRASDFVSSRTSHTLEWIIIVLLATETILLVIDLLSSAARSGAV